MLIFYLAILFGVGVAQRPQNASTCDFYTQQLYGSNTAATQLQLVQGIIAVAFGGNFNISSISPNITGIFNPGEFQGLQVDLLPWFDGSLPSTNLNNQGVGVNWLDDGGLDPLEAYLNGTTSDIVLKNGTNQYRLFTHWFVAFSDMFGCSSPPSYEFNSDGTNLAYIHKFMNLNNTDIGHFINQLVMSELHFGFSEEDSQSSSNMLNNLYNVACAPPITINATQGPQLLSLCQAPDCPLAVPSADCAAYVNLTADGTPSGPLPTVASSTTSSTASTASSTITGATSPSGSPLPASSPSLSAAAIAGIAIGGAAVLILLVGAIVFCLRRQKQQGADPRPPPISEAPDYATLPMEQKDDVPYVANGPPLSNAPPISHEPPPVEMESPRNPTFPMSEIDSNSPTRIGSPDMNPRSTISSDNVYSRHLGSPEINAGSPAELGTASELEASEKPERLWGR